jgi:hypothetical protein
MAQDRQPLRDAGVECSRLRMPVIRDWPPIGLERIS